MRSLVLLALLSLAVGCGGNDGTVEGPTGPVALFRLMPEAPEEFYDLPFPSDLRRDPDGTISLAHFPEPQPALLVSDYVDAAEELHAFGTTTVTYFRFSEKVDTSSLPPSPEAALDADASVFLIDVDEAGPSAGTRHPAVVVYQEESTKYWASRTVAIRPVIGRPLAWGRKYAAVVTRAVRPGAGGSFSRDADFEALMAGEGREEILDARALYEGPLAVVEAAGVPRDQILSMTVFTTQDDFRMLEQARDHLVASGPAPALAEPPAQVSAPTGYVVLEGHYTSPTYQHGTLPYSSIDDGGAFEWDQDGDPVLAETFEQRFTLSIPSDRAMPTGGFPLVLYAHGTGGSAYTAMGNGVASRLAAEGIAVMGIDQLHHAPRVDLTEEETQVAVYNVLNPQAFRYNALQAALDVVQQARMVLAPLEIDAEAIPGLDTAVLETSIVSFDPERIFFMGHSQGGQNGPLFLAVDDTAKAAMLSGAGAQFTLALLEKVEPLSIPEILASVLFLPGTTPEDKLAYENISPEHPILNLLQTWMDVADPVNYAHRFFVDPRQGFAPKHVFMTEGIDDSYTPPASIEALAIAAEVPLLAPVLVPIEEKTRVGEVAECPPAVDNTAMGVTAGLSQYASADVGATDGHFVTFREPAMTQVQEFFASAALGAPTIVEGSACTP